MEERIKSLKTEYDNIPVPAEALNRIQAGINKAKEETKVVRFPVLKKTGLGVAAAFAICFIGVNASATVANAAGNLPLIGKFFEVITLRSYETENVTAQIPEIKTDSSDAAKELNEKSLEYVDNLIKEFEADCQKYGMAYKSLDVTYNVLTDSDYYFALEIAGTETAASGYSFKRIYTIDKATDKVLALGDLFSEDFDYISSISAEIIRQMEADKGTDYFIGEENDGFTEIRPDQNFYIDEHGNIVICFDEYEVGPGSIGTPRFVIPKDIF